MGGTDKAGFGALSVSGAPSKTLTSFEASACQCHPTPPLSNGAASSPVRHARRRGSIFIAAAGILTVLTALALVLAQQMRIEVLASGNRLSQMQADSAERGGEQFVLSQIDGSLGNAVNVCAVSGEALQVGDAYFWVMAANPDNPQQYNFCITDEASKISLNSAGTTTLNNLPNMTTDVAASIIAWRSTTTTSQTADDDTYYMTQPQPYQHKGAPFESVEELLLVRGVDSQLLFGYDTNHNGVIDAAESSAGGMATQIDAAQGGSLGLFPLVTAFSVEPNTSASGAARVNINTVSYSALSTLLQKTMSSARANAIVALVRTRRPFLNIFDFAVRTGLTSTEFAGVANRITTSSAKTLTGMVNVNTASQAVLSCLPALTASDAQALVAKRQGITTPTTDMTWVLGTLTNAKAVAIGGMITGRSYRFSADIVGVSGDGRAYKRVRIVADATQSPPTIIYRKDLTDLGWPLDPAIRTSLRAGQGLPSGIVNPSGGL
jgi:DNA uptake protein ComE-like DNA-binding protein